MLQEIQEILDGLEELWESNEDNEIFNNFHYIAEIFTQNEPDEEYRKTYDHVLNFLREADFDGYNKDLIRYYYKAIRSVQHNSGIKIDPEERKTQYIQQNRDTIDQHRDELEDELFENVCEGNSLCECGCQDKELLVDKKKKFSFKIRITK